MATAVVPDQYVIPFSSVTVGNVIGHGAFGKVYRAQYKAENQDVKEVAFKELHITLAADKEKRKLQSEVCVHCKLKDDNVIQLFGVVCEPGAQHGIIMELATHGDVLNFFNKFQQVEWPWKLQMAQHIVLGMNYLHSQQPRPLIHGDLKAKNILVCQGFIAKIADFGLSNWKRNTLTASRSEMTCGGTVTHIPPESWSDINHKRTVKFDVYSFAVLLWEMLAYPTRPYNDQADCKKIREMVLSGERPPLEVIPAGKPLFLREIIGKCWAQEQDERPTFADLKLELECRLKEHETDVNEAKRNLQWQQQVDGRCTKTCPTLNPTNVPTNPLAGQQALDQSVMLSKALINLRANDDLCSNAADHSHSPVQVCDTSPPQTSSSDYTTLVPSMNTVFTDSQQQLSTVRIAVTSQQQSSQQQSTDVCSVREFCSWLDREDWALQFYHDNKDKVVIIEVKNIEEASKKLACHPFTGGLPPHRLDSPHKYEFHLCMQGDSNAPGTAPAPAPAPAAAAAAEHVMLRPGARIKKDNAVFLLSGSIVDQQTGITVAHPLQPGDIVSDCNTSQRVGQCREIFTVVEKNDQFKSRLTADMAVLTLDTDTCRVDNCVVLHGAVHNLQVYRGPLEDSAPVMIIDRNGTAHNGCIRTSHYASKSAFLRGTGIGLHDVITISSDGHFKEMHITEEGDSGALVLSRPVSADNTLFVYGIVLGYLDVDDKNTSMTVANNLQEVLPNVARLSHGCLQGVSADNIQFTHTPNTSN